MKAWFFVSWKVVSRFAGRGTRNSSKTRPTSKARESKSSTEADQEEPLQAIPEGKILSPDKKDAPDGFSELCISLHFHGYLYFASTLFTLKILRWWTHIPSLLFPPLRIQDVWNTFCLWLRGFLLHLGWFSDYFLSLGIQVPGLLP